MWIGPSKEIPVSLRWPIHIIGAVDKTKIVLCYFFTTVIEVNFFNSSPSITSVLPQRDILILTCVCGSKTLLALIFQNENYIYYIQKQLWNIFECFLV